MLRIPCRAPFCLTTIGFAQCQMFDCKVTVELITLVSYKILSESTAHKNLFSMLCTRAVSHHGKETQYSCMKLHTNEARVESATLAQTCLHHTYRTFSCIVIVELTALINFSSEPVGSWSHQIELGGLR